MPIKENIVRATLVRAELRFASQCRTDSQSGGLADDGEVITDIDGAGWCDDIGEGNGEEEKV